MMSEDVTVKIPKAMANFIRKQEWFKLYDDLDEFVVDAVRHQMETRMRTEAK